MTAHQPDQKVVNPARKGKMGAAPASSETDDEDMPRRPSVLDGGLFLFAGEEVSED